MTTSEMTPADFAAISGNNDGFGGNNGWWILLLFLFGMNGGWGFGGGFGGGYGNMMLGYDFPWLLNGQNNINANTNEGFRDAMLNDGITSIRDGISGLSTQLCGGFAGTTAAITNAQNALAQQLYTNQIADMNQNFALQSSLQNCCCENRAATQDLKYTVASESCATRTADAANTTAVLNALNAGVQSIKDQLCADKIEEKNDVIAQLRSELLYARGQASQDVQTAAIQAGQRNLANEVEQYVLPTPRPAYIVQNPNCCTTNYSCGCGSF